MAAEFSIVHRVGFSETDLAGVVHFANYFRWMEEVEHAFFRAQGMSVVMDHGAHGGGQLGWPRIAASCEYLGPARFEEEITLTLRVARVGDKSFSYEVDFQRDGQLLAKGKLTSVCCAMGQKGFEAVPIPPAIRAKLNG